MNKELVRIIFNDYPTIWEEMMREVRNKELQELRQDFET
eukprot:CAMPEP_0168316524 /NCGR_PEP_ID=MMETSP0210-20121227/16175_1 /TAXON_ID=40633 /ORGANISM="Condylostoma magnum, Strain COL2" /LENGTH=38 /DNA_ID= /DNA_START= /DNA_END= /DNA_ORIENTATION=